MCACVCACVRVYVCLCVCVCAYMHACTVCVYVCVYLWRCRGRRMMLSVHCSTPQSYRSNCKSRKGEGGQERREEEGWTLERLEQIECRSCQQWEGETNRISLKGTETQRVMKVFLLLSRVVFYLSICSEGLKWHKATMFRPLCTSAQFQTSHLSHYAFTVCACVYVWCMRVCTSLCVYLPIYVYLFVYEHMCVLGCMYNTWACLWVYMCESISEITAGMGELHIIIEMNWCQGIRCFRFWVCAHVCMY